MLMAFSVYAILSEENEMQKTNRECFFSIELKSKECLKTVKFADGNGKESLVEGTIGQLQHAGFAEGIVFEVFGNKGIFRIDLCQEQIQNENKMEVKK